VIMVLALGSGNGGASGARPERKPEEGRPADVRGLEEQGERKCEEGMVAVRAVEEKMTGGTLSVEEQRELRKGLEKAKALLEDGIRSFDEAHQRSGNTYDLMRYQKALKAVRQKLLELAP